MLEFIIGRAGTGKTEECLRAMQQEMRREAVGPALILLLPEHMTYKVERQLAAFRGACRALRPRAGDQAKTGNRGGHVSRGADGQPRCGGRSTGLS